MSDKNQILQKKNLAEKPQLVAPVNAVDELNMNRLYNNQEVILEHVKEFTKEVISIKRDMRKIIVEEVAKQFDAKKMEFEGLYRSTVILGKLLQEAGHFTQEDINKKYKELKAKK